MALRRRESSFSTRPVWLVVCEGEKTEPEYFKRWKSKTAVGLEIHEVGGGNPYSAVQRAIRLRAKRPADARFDEVWCVTDGDGNDQALLRSARLLAERSGIHLILSNPCFELWALLHFEEVGTWLDAAGARRRLRSYLPDYGKLLPFATLEPHLDLALERARRLESQAGENPSTAVHHLVAALLAHSRDRLA
jgi:RloB-like protein